MKAFLRDYWLTLVFGVLIVVAVAIEISGIYEVLTIPTLDVRC